MSSKLFVGDRFDERKSSVGSVVNPLSRAGSFIGSGFEVRRSAAESVVEAEIGFPESIARSSLDRFGFGVQGRARLAGSFGIGVRGSIAIFTHSDTRAQETTKVANDGIETGYPNHFYLPRNINLAEVS